MRRILLIIAALLLVPALAVHAAEPIKLGLILPMTGPAAPYGDMAHKGVEMAMADRPTVMGRPVKVILADSKSDKMEASNAAHRLIQRDQVAAIIGPLSSSTTLAAAPVAENARIPLLSGWATNPTVTVGKKYVFRACFIDPFQGGVAANYALKELKAKKAAIIMDVARDYSAGLAAFFTRTFTKGGGKVVLRTQYTTGDQEFGAQVGAIKAANPDLIYLPGYAPEVPLIIRQAREAGLNQPFLGGDAAQADEVLKIGGKAVEGLMLTTHFDENGATTEEGKRYSQRYRAKHNKAPDPLGALGYDSYMIMLNAITKAGSLDPEALVKALDNTRDHPGVCGVTSLVNHNAVKPAVILKVIDGKYTYVGTVQP